MMAIERRCPNKDCGRLLSFDEGLIGSKCQCEHCGCRFMLRRAKPKRPPARPGRGQKHKAGVASPNAAAGSTPPSRPEAASGKLGSLVRRLRRPKAGTTFFAAGAIGMLLSSLIPFYARLAPDLPAPGLLDPWHGGTAAERCLVVFQCAGLALVGLAVVKLGARRLRIVLVLGVAAAFWATWLLAAQRARMFAGPHLGIGGAWRGLGVGAILFMAGGGVVVASGWLKTPSGTGKFVRRAGAIGAVSALILVGVGLILPGAWKALGLEPFDLDASVVPGRDVCGAAVPGSVAVRLELTNNRSQPVLIVARRGGQRVAGGDGPPAYWLRVRTRSVGEPLWRRVRMPAWSGPWPSLDFRAARELEQGENWCLESLVYREDLKMLCSRRPQQVAVELLDRHRRWSLRRILNVAAPVDD
jgi:hypothetical protein